MPKKEEKKVEKVKDYLAETFKTLQKEKSKRKRAAKKAKPKTEKELKEITIKEIRNTINALKRLLKAKIIITRPHVIQALMDPSTIIFLFEKFHLKKIFLYRALSAGIANLCIHFANALRSFHPTFPSCC